MEMDWLCFSLVIDASAAIDSGSALCSRKLSHQPICRT